MPILSLQEVSKDYLTDGQRVHALSSVSLNVERGEFVAMVGRSGCGKSTLLNLAGAMDFPTSGNVLLDGVSTSSLKDSGLTQLRREGIGFIFQSFQLLHTLTVFENIELPLLLAGKSSPREAARERLAWVELEGLGHRYPHQLSGGQMQRVAIARALSGAGPFLADNFGDRFGRCGCAGYRSCGRRSCRLVPQFNGNAGWRQRSGSRHFRRPV